MFYFVDNVLLFDSPYSSETIRGSQAGGVLSKLTPEVFTLSNVGRVLTGGVLSGLGLQIY